jgi:hypothetical protein
MAVEVGSYAWHGHLSFLVVSAGSDRAAAAMCRSTEDNIFHNTDNVNTINVVFDVSARPSALGGETLPAPVENASARIRRERQALPASAM